MTRKRKNELKTKEYDLEFFRAKDRKEDARPDPRPRTNMRLWQAYSIWDEVTRIRIKHGNRIATSLNKKSNMDPQTELDFLNSVNLRGIEEYYREEMINYGMMVGPIWEWLTAIKGLKAGGEAAKLLAQVDDITRFDTVSKLWRFCGYAVVEGKAEKNKAGEISHFNRKLKAICFVIADQFIRQQTPYYADIYYAEKARQRELHPEKVTKPEGGVIYTDNHVHYRAWRKMIKEFLKDFWVAWRIADGLAVPVQMMVKQKV